MHQPKPTHDAHAPVLDEVLKRLSRARQDFHPAFAARETGRITTVASGVAKVSGLPSVGFEELIRFPGDEFAIAFNLDEEEVGVILLGDGAHLHAGMEVERTGRVMDVPVGPGLLGRIIDPLGRPLDGQGPIDHTRRLPIERPAPAILDRAPVSEPLQTGIKVVDALIPIGHGQRELILGDRQSGKTAIALDTILHQRGKDVVCLYCAISQRASSVARVLADLRERGALPFTVAVVTEGNDAPGLKFIAPYAATSLAESFMEAGRRVVIVYDDLTQHARAYRELSLLLRRPPGREAFPGDIFYIHSRLLERATQLRPELGGGSLTALPIIETEAQNIAAYIPTNLISITDGQIYVSPTLFELGLLPAIDVGRSVSRVGGKAQIPAYHAVSGSLKLAYSQFEELEAFARFGTRLDQNTRESIEHGRRIRACLQQPQYATVPVPEQLAVLIALTGRLFDGVALERMADAEQAARRTVDQWPREIAQRLLNGESHSARISTPFSRSPARPSPRSWNIMSETLEELRRSIQNASQLKKVVRTLKVMAAVNIAQYEQAVRALADYANSIELGMIAWARQAPPAPDDAAPATRAPHCIALVFGTDQGMVGQFNDSLANDTAQTLGPWSGNLSVWAIGERVGARLSEASLPVEKVYAVPNSIPAITPLTQQLLLQLASQRESAGQVLIFHQTPTSALSCSPRHSRLLPLDQNWRQDRERSPWPNRMHPELLVPSETMLRALVNEYLFVSLFRACAESGACENASRLSSMQRADKNIGEWLDELGRRFHQRRQSSIDEELFDVLAGFEALTAPLQKHQRRQK